MRLLIVIAMTLALSGCGAVYEVIAVITGYTNVCIDGVHYLQFTTGAETKIEQDGKPVKC